MNIAYEKAIQRMVKRVSQMATGDWTPTPTMKECLRVAKVLEDAANVLADTSAAADIERLHERLGGPDYPDGPAVGLDGHPVPHDEVDWPGYEAIKRQIRTLAESARKAAADLPDPRYKPALPAAALAMLHIRHDYDFPPPATYIDGEAVIELERIAHEAGIPVLSRDSYKKALEKALKKFDPRYRPPEIYGLT